MGFKTGHFPPEVDPATFRDLPFRDRLRAMSTHWVDYGFGTPEDGALRLHPQTALPLCRSGGTALATLTSGLSWLDVASWWNQPIVYQKMLLWTVLLERSASAAPGGPLAGHFKPMTGGFHFWLKPDTIRLPPWPDKVPPGTAGDRRTLGDVLIYAALIADLLVAVLLPGMHTDALDSLVADNAGLIRPAVVAPLIVLLVVIGLRDKVIFLAARGEQYLPAIVFFTFLPFVDMIVRSSCSSSSCGSAPASRSSGTTSRWWSRR